MPNSNENGVTEKSWDRDYLLEVFKGDGDYWFQCRSVHRGESESDQSSYASSAAPEQAGQIFIDRKIEVNNVVSNVEIRWPWTMLPLSAADEYIEYLQKQISPEHPLYSRKVFPACIREDTQELIVQFDLDDDNTYAIVFFSEKQLFGNKEMPKVEMIGSVSELQNRFDQDYTNALKSIDS